MGGSECVARDFKTAHGGAAIDREESVTVAIYLGPNPALGGHVLHYPPDIGFVLPKHVGDLAGANSRGILDDFKNFGMNERHGVLS